MEEEKQNYKELLDDLKKKEPTEKEAKENMKMAYINIICILKKYCDLKEEYYHIISLWIIGTYIHKKFPTFPHLFFNAMKGSGKTRLLKLCSSMAYNGKMLIDLKESVLFRTAAISTFFIDEFEHIASDDKRNLRVLLNASYKRGLSVERSKKVKFCDGEDFIVDKFNLYCPIAMANIWGMEDVLSDRCISMTLERSNDMKRVRLLELFDEDDEIKAIKSQLGSVREVDIPLQRTYKQWNDYISNISTNTTTTTTYIPSTNTTFLKRVENSTLNSRDLELFFPLFIIADICGGLDEIINIAEGTSSAKKEEELIENEDIALYEFISQYEDDGNFVQLKQIMERFKIFYSDEYEDSKLKWFNSKWMGRALKRLNLIKNKRKVHGCREIILNVKKAKEKINIFHPVIKQLQVETKTETKKIIYTEADYYKEMGNIIGEDNLQRILKENMEKQCESAEIIPEIIKVTKEEKA